MIKNFFVTAMAMVAWSTIVNAGALSEDQRESPFFHHWHAPIVPFAARRVVMGKHLPDIAELHQTLGRRAKTDADRVQENSILADLRGVGLRPDTYAHLRVTCRTSLCETVIVLKSSIGWSKEGELVRGVNDVDHKNCKRPVCECASTLTSSYDKGNGVAIMTYYIPDNQNFL